MIYLPFHSSCIGHWKKWILCYGGDVRSLFFSLRDFSGKSDKYILNTALDLNLVNGHFAFISFIRGWLIRTTHLVYFCCYCNIFYGWTVNISFRRPALLLPLHRKVYWSKTDQCYSVGGQLWYGLSNCSGTNNANA